MNRKIIISLMMASIINSYVFAEPKINMDDSINIGISDPLARYIEIYEPRNIPGNQLWRIKKDFNNDGYIDITISSSKDFSGLKKPWLLFLGRKDGKYNLLSGDLSFYPRGYRLLKDKKGIGILQHCERISASLCQPYKIKITSQEISAMSINSDLVDVDRFNRDYRAAPPYYEYCEVVSYKNNAECEWHEQF